MQGMPMQSNSNLVGEWFEAGGRATYSNLVGEWLEAGGGATYSNPSLCAGEHGRGDKDGETNFF